MNKSSCFLIFLCVFYIVPSALGDIYATGGYFDAEAQVDLSLGSDSEHNYGDIPVQAYAALAGDLGGAASMAEADLLNVACWSALEFLPPILGGAGSSAGSALFGIYSTTPWLLNIESVFSINPSPAGLAGVTAEASLLDGDSNEIYSYNLDLDGLTDSALFAAGSYELTLFVTSYAWVQGPSDVPEYIINSTVETTATLTPVPVPSSTLLAFFGFCFACLFLCGINPQVMKSLK